MLVDVLLLIVALLVILGSSELFTNGVEWLGQRLHLSEGVVGSVLAAVGTALPETLRPAEPLARAVYESGWRPPYSPGPTRDELVEVVARATRRPSRSTARGPAPAAVAAS